MRHLVRPWIVLGAIASACVVPGGRAHGGQAVPRPPAITPEQVEADWLRQAELRYRPPRPGAMRPEEDAAGGNDGVRDGRNVGYYGFHTDKQRGPWWQVDLGAPTALRSVVIYNGSTIPDAKRALGLIVLVSADGKAWTQVYRHNGSMFLGPKQPLTVKLDRARGRHVRVQLPYVEYLHLDEIEVYTAGSDRNVALGRPATQSSVSKWSRRERGAASAYPTAKVIERGLQLADGLRRLGANVAGHAKILRAAAVGLKALGPDAPADAERRLYLRAQWAVRRMALRSPLIDFDKLLFVKRAPNRLVCHCDEYLSCWSRPGGELCVLEGFAGEAPRLRSLTAGKLPPGDILRPDVSHDAAKVLFAYCRHYPGLWQRKNKLDKAAIPEDAFYHLYEINLDGTGLRRLTRGRYDDMDGRYLPDGGTVFLSTRRGQFVQCGQASAAATLAKDDLPDCFVRCGGDAYRPVSIHTLHRIDADGRNLRTLSPFETTEWNPSVTHDGRVLYARWDYVDRHRMWHMGLWSTLPDGTAARAVFGNYTEGPYSFFEARCVPGSPRMVFTASAHHSHAGGSLILLDPESAVDGHEPMTRLTPDVPLPEWETRDIRHFYASPYPLSERHYLCAWSDQALPFHRFERSKVSPHYGAPVPGPVNGLGVYLLDAFGNLNLLYRDPKISSMYPIPVRSPRRLPAVAPSVIWDGPQEGRMLLQDVYQGDLRGVRRGSIRALRIVGVPPKTHPVMNNPNLGVTGDDPGKFVLGTVPVEPDGSAYFRVPSGVLLFFQALGADGMAVQTMRSAAYVQPGQTYACIGCHEPRLTAPPAGRTPRAARREASKIRPGPEGTWPLDFDVLVQPVLNTHCVRCHHPRAKGKSAAINLTAGRAYRTVIGVGGDRSLRKHVSSRYNARRSTAGACGAMAGWLTQHLKKGHSQVKLRDDDWQRLIIWMDTYAQRRGYHSADQHRRLLALRTRMAGMLAAPSQSPEEGK